MNVQTSFIPKKPLQGRPGGDFGSATDGVFFIITLFIFIASVIAAISTFSYREYLNTAIDSKKKSLALAEGALEMPIIQELVRIDLRINNAKILLQKHKAPSAIFNILSQQTLQNVSFTTFEYTIKENGAASVIMNGQAGNFSTVALQSDQFGKSKVLKDVIFSDITVDPSGKITFIVKTKIDSGVINYVQNLKVDAQVESVIGVPTVPAATSSAVQ